jgi:hypothetical protein
MPFPPTLAPAARSAAPTDFVLTDLAQLASHMERCARARDPLFAFKRHLQNGRSALAGRIVTVAFAGAIVVAVALTFA